jgi:hypothetical protein
MEIKKILSVAICDWFHGGGKIERDPKGKINWQCSTCGRWADSPVPIEHESKLIDSHIEKRLKKILTA